jgi:hypothetical protein|tara:strand:- start:281 stop:745 length:465 start_codon:yes stop_codon:yes gene_type:complete
MSTTVREVRDEEEEEEELKKKAEEEEGEDDEEEEDFDFVPDANDKESDDEEDADVYDEDVQEVSTSTRVRTPAERCVGSMDPIRTLLSTSSPRSKPLIHPSCTLHSPFIHPSFTLHSPSSPTGFFFAEEAGACSPRQAQAQEGEGWAPGRHRAE